MTEKIRLGRVTEATIRNALLYIRAECIRDGAPGIDHVDALLRLRGHDPDNFAFAKKAPKAFRRGDLQFAILTALRDGPRTGAAIAAQVKGDLDQKAAYKRVYIALHRMKAKGMVKHEGRLWLAP